MKIKRILSALIAGTVAMLAMVLSAAAQDIEKGVMKFSDREFLLKGMDNVKLGEDPGSFPGWDAILVLGRDSEDTAKLIGQNYNVWKNINKVTASFYLEDVDGTAFAEDIGFIQICGVMGEGANWAWFQNDANLLEQNETFEFGADNVMTATWEVNDIMAKNGKDVENGGILKLMLMIGNDGIDDYNLKIVWTDVTVEGDEAAMAEAVATVKNFSAAAVEEVIEVAAEDVTLAADEEVVQVTVEAAAGNTAAPAASTKASADTGIEGVAVVAAIAVIGAGSAIVVRRKSK